LTRTFAIESCDSRWPFVRVQHDSNSAILADVGDGLHAYPGKSVKAYRKGDTDLSIPDPDKSSYQTLRELATWKVPSTPFGEILTSPSAVRGAEATKNICCFSIHAMRKSGISPNICMVAGRLQTKYEVGRKEGIDGNSATFR
jgi:hypothetical protein